MQPTTTESTMHHAHTGPCLRPGRRSTIRGKPRQAPLHPGAPLTISRLHQGGDSNPTEGMLRAFYVCSKRNILSGVGPYPAVHRRAEELGLDPPLRGTIPVDTSGTRRPQPGGTACQSRPGMHKTVCSLKHSVLPHRAGSRVTARSTSHVRPKPHFRPWFRRRVVPPPYACTRVQFAPYFCALLGTNTPQWHCGRFLC